jgi:hypothetical protein
MSEVHEKLLAAQQKAMQAGAALSEQKSMQAVGGFSVGREKFWHERDKDERLEALRHEVIGLHHQLQIQRGQIEALLNHGHAVDGRVMQAIDCRNQQHGALWIPTSLRREDEEKQYAW